MHSLSTTFAPVITKFRTAAERQRAAHLTRILTHIHTAHLAGHPLTPACATQAPAADLSASSLYRLYRQWIAAGRSPLALARNYHAGPDKGLPPAFLDHWKHLCLTTRCNESAHRTLLKQWQAHRSGTGPALPGYPIAPPPSATGKPLGWTYENLSHHAPEKRGLLASRQGRDAVRATLPSITTTRAGMHYLQERQWDDMWHNLEVIVPGHTQLRRILQFGSLDVASGYAFRPGLRPRLPREDGTAIQLNSRDFRLYYAYILTTIGYSPRGTRENIENGTATLPKHLADHITAHTGGLVTFAASGIHRAPALPGQFKSIGKGNPRHKAHLESYHNLLQNELSSLPGQVGRSPDTAPGELIAARRHTERLLEIAAHLPPAIAAQLQHDHLTYAAAEDIIHATIHALNRRTDHQLEGYREAGYITELYRLTETADFLPADQIAPALRAALTHAASQTPALYRQRLATPAEVAARLHAATPEPILLSPLALPDLLPEEVTPRKVTTRGTIRWTADGLTHEYLADLGEGPLPAGRTYDIFANPFSPEHIVVMEPKSGRILGLAPQWKKSQRDDVADITRRTGEVAAQYRAATAEAAASVGLRRLSASLHNTTVLRGVARLPGPLTPAPKLATRGQYDPAAPTDLLDAPTPAADETPADETHNPYADDLLG